jgi:hypothetical protein
MDENSNEIKRYNTGPYTLENFLCKNSIILQPAAFFRLDLARQVGGWNPDFFIADTEMWLRMLFRAPAQKVDAFWGIRRMHSDQRNSQSAKIVNSYQKMIKESQDLKHSSLKLKRAAWAGSLITAAGYNPWNSSVMQKIAFLKAVLIYPPVFKSQKLHYRLFPWLSFFSRTEKKIRHQGSKIKHLLMANEK